MFYDATLTNERALQKQRRLLVGLFSLGLLLLSISLEMHQREIDPRQLLENLARFLIAIIDRDASPPPIDLVANIKGLLAVLRNLVSAIITFWLVLRIGERFVHAVYGTVDEKAAGEYLRGSLFGVVIGPRPYLAKVFSTAVLEQFASELIKSRPFVIVGEGRLASGNNDPSVRIGGPATLIIRNDSAALLERAGRLTRILGPGMHALRRFEKIRAVVDLRPQWYQYTVDGISREGIPIKWTIDVHFRINDAGAGRHSATEQNPFPFSEEAVLIAATDQWMREPDSADHLDWRDRLVLGEAEGRLRAIMAQHNLDFLIKPKAELAELLAAEFTERELDTICDAYGISYDDLPGSDPTAKMSEFVADLERRNGILTLIDMVKTRRPDVDWSDALPPRIKIQQQLEVALRMYAADHGAKILDVALRNIELRDPVAQQWLDNWKASWDLKRRKLLATAGADRVLKIENAKAEAKRQMLEAIVEAYTDLIATKGSIPSEVVLFRFIETLRRFAAPTWAFAFTEYPDQALATLRRLRDSL